MFITRKKNNSKTTISKHWLMKYANLNKTMELKRPVEVFVSDITFLKIKERTCYLSLVTDAYSRKNMGYNLCDNMNSEKDLKTLNMAVRQRNYSWQLIHHSDRGL